jgi:putative ubiquitin-RnfH superfamily antitoxin RatB of RatAB toxin-antitoxin module
MAVESSISVEVIYAAPDRVFFERVDLPAGSRLRDAIARSSFPGRFPQVELSDQNVGIDSRKVGLDCELRHDDRVEIYRPLLLTPNEIRLLRAKRKGKKR